MDIEKVKNCVEQFVSDNDMFIVDIKYNDLNVVDITIDSMKGTSLDKCIELSKFIESQVDREIEDYELTVSGASISEPFKHIKQYYKNSGKEIEVLLLSNEKIKGVLGDVTESSFTITHLKKVVEDGKKRKVLVEFCDPILYSDVRKAALVLSF